MTTSEVTEESVLQTSTTPGDNTACDECLENNVALEDDESICLACSGVCPFCQYFTTGSPLPAVMFPSWRLNWCPRRIGGNPNRHFSWVQSFLSNREIIFQAEEIPPMLLPSKDPKTPRRPVGMYFQVHEIKKLILIEIIL